LLLSPILSCMPATMLTLPDYLHEGLAIVFVGINPGLYSAKVGHYFATPRNRFWSAFNAATLTPAQLGPETDRAALRHGIGFTDVVKRATRQMHELKLGEFREGAQVLREKLLRYQPRIVCFNGLSGYKRYAQFTGGDPSKAHLGLQDVTIGTSKIFVMPSTSPANAAVPLSQIVAALQELKRLVASFEKRHAHD